MDVRQPIRTSMPSKWWDCSPSTTQTDRRVPCRVAALVLQLQRRLELDAAAEAVVRELDRPAAEVEPVCMCVGGRRKRRSGRDRDGRARQRCNATHAPPELQEEALWQALQGGGPVAPHQLLARLAVVPAEKVGFGKGLGQIDEQDIHCCRSGDSVLVPGRIGHTRFQSMYVHVLGAREVEVLAQEMVVPGLVDRLGAEGLQPESMPAVSAPPCSLSCVCGWVGSEGD